MIERISVRGVGGITRADLDFSGSFIAITGESGAGKSSVVRAFEFITGRRASASMINAASDQSTVEALWSSPDGDFMTKRVMDRSGKSRAFIDDSMATAGMLASRTAPLIEIQSQFAQLDLLDPARQLAMVDGAGGPDLLAARARLAEVFPEIVRLEREIAAARERRAQLESELDGAPDLLRRIKRLSSQGTEREWEAELAACERRLADAGRHEALAARLLGSESEPGLADELASALRELYAAAPDDARDEWTRLGEAALTNFQQLLDSARRELAIYPIDELEARRDAAEGILGDFRRVRRETGASTPEEFERFVAETAEKNRWLAESADRLAAMTADAARAKAEAASLARELRAMRTAAARGFETRVSEHLRDLAMEDAVFTAEVTKLDRVRANGAESVSFALSQKGMPPSPVAKAASGGELSRILIAIQSSMETRDLPGSIVFDEVEAGLGGRAALLAGQKLRELSTRCRVILITHEATIAAMADTHFVVRRLGDETSVCEIDGDERVREIARMLAGSDSPAAMDHARDLLTRGSA